jgi:hypothetical protein
MAEPELNCQCGSSWKLADKCHGGRFDGASLTIRAQAALGEILLNLQIQLRNPNNWKRRHDAMHPKPEARRPLMTAIPASVYGTQSLFGFRNKKALHQLFTNS